MKPGGESRLEPVERSQPPGRRGLASAAELHERAVAEADRGRHAASRRLLRAALRREPDPVRRAHILVSLAYQEGEWRTLAAGLALLDDADRVPGLPRRVRGLVAGQRGLLNMRAGQWSDAMTAFDAALRLLDESLPEDLCRALLNSGVLHLRQRSLARARENFDRCLQVATAHRLGLIAAKANHNLGYLSMLAGDLPRALHQMDAVGPVLHDLSPAIAASCLADRAQALLAAGLVTEADEDLARAVETFGASRMRQNQAEAELTRAEVAVAQERWDDARRLGRRARRRFTARGARAWALLAELVSVTAVIGSQRDLATAADTAARLAGELSAVGLADEGRRAALAAATAQLRRRDVSGARDAAKRAIVLRADDPIATRLQARAVRAGLAEAEGRPHRADAERRAALTDLHRYQSSFGSLDLQTAASRHGRYLAEAGLARALTGGRPAAVFGWAERARALTSRLPVVVPPSDAEAAALLEELRNARLVLREQTIARQVDPALRSRCTELERLIRHRSWHLVGPGEVTSPVSLGRVQDELAPVNGGLVAHLLVAGRVHALVASKRRRAIVDLGPGGPVVELRRRLQADLDVLAGGALQPRIDASVRAALRTSVRRLDALLWVPLRTLLPEGPLVLVPSAGLATAPWTMLPTMADRPLTVAPSATAWLENRRRATLPAAPTVRLAAGPQVPRGQEEVQAAGNEWPDASILAGQAATAQAVRQAAASADVLHVAAHGVHERDNPLFSHVELVDGPLFGHEFDQLPRLPAHVVLSACDLGLTDTRPGDETLGMTAALLHGGAGSVVAGVARIADTVACRTGAAHHAALRRGLSPAEALAAAVVTAGEDPAPLVCFGSGW